MILPAQVSGLQCQQLGLLESRRDCHKAGIMKALRRCSDVPMCVLQLDAVTAFLQSFEFSDADIKKVRCFQLCLFVSREAIVWYRCCSHS